MVRRKKGAAVHGWVVLDKPEGVTSTRAVALVKRIFDAQKAGHAGTLDPETFVLRLFDQQLFMPVRDEKNVIQGFQRSTQADPLIIEDEDGERVLILFTSPERAKPFIEHFPDFSGGLLTEFSWLLRRIGGGVPISLNPGWDVGMDFDADMTAQLVTQLPPEHSA